GTCRGDPMARMPLSRRLLQVTLAVLGWLATGFGVAVGADGVPALPPPAPPRTAPAAVGGGAEAPAAAPPGAEGAPGGTGEGAPRSPTPTGGGGSKASGGDPTTTGRAQEVGNPHLGKLSLDSYYDFDDDGFKWATKDDEFSLGLRGMTQLDARVYDHSGP